MPVLVALALAPMLGTILAWTIWAVIIIWILQQWWFWATLISSVLCFVTWVVSKMIRMKKRTLTSVLVGIVICVFIASFSVSKDSLDVPFLMDIAPQAQLDIAE